MVTSRWGKGAGSPNAFVGAMSVLAVLAGCGGEAPGIAPETMPRPALVHRVALSAGATEHRFVGRVQALQSVPLAFEVSGVLASLAPREGDYFVAGERLAQLDPEPFVLARRRAQVELELASLRLERAEALRDRGSLAVAEVDEARAWRALKEVAFDEAQKALDDTSLYAPFDGRLARRHREPAMHVPMGDAVLTALDLSQVKIIVQLGRARRLELEDGGRFLAEAIFPGAPEQAFPLRLLDNRAEADAGAQSYEVAFALDQPADLPPCSRHADDGPAAPRSERQPPGDSRGSPGGAGVLCGEASRVLRLARRPGDEYGAGTACVPWFANGGGGPCPCWAGSRRRGRGGRCHPPC